MKQTIAGDKSTVRGSKKSSTLLCARKNPKKKKRNKFGANYNDDGYPHYATTAIDGRYRRDLYICIHKYEYLLIKHLHFYRLRQRGGTYLRGSGVVLS